MITELSAFWKGPWEISRNKVPYEITDADGLYIILTGKRERILHRWKIFDQIIAVGYFKNIRKGLRDNGDWDAWEKHSQKSILVKAVTFPKPIDFNDALFCFHKNITILTATTPLGKEDESQSGLLVIKNKGQKWPLPESIQCHLPIIPINEDKPEDDNCSNEETVQGKSI